MTELTELPSPKNKSSIREQNTEPIDPLVYEQKMCDYVRSEEWQTPDEDPRGRGVYLCLNMLCNTQTIDDPALLLEIKRVLAENNIRYNPYNMTVDGISSQGMNLGIVIDERNFDSVLTNSQLAISNAIRRGKPYRTEDWREKENKFDFRPGLPGNKTIHIKNIIEEAKYKHLPLV